MRAWPAPTSAAETLPVDLAAIAATLAALLLFFGRDIPADYDVAQLRVPSEAIRDRATFRAGWVVLAHRARHEFAGEVLRVDEQDAHEVRATLLALRSVHHLQDVVVLDLSARPVIAGLATELGDQFEQLADAGRAQGVALGFEASRGVDRNPSAQGEIAALGTRTTLAERCQPEILGHPVGHHHLLRTEQFEPAAQQRLGHDGRALQDRIVKRVRDELGPVAAFHDAAVVDMLPKTRSDHRS